MTMQRERIEEIAARFRGIRVLVLGDLMLDRFIWGGVSRISPEAPVPVVEVQSEESFPGGAANVARNLREFSDAVSVLGVVGLDPFGDELMALLSQAGIDTRCVGRATGTTTTVKTRVIARTQQVVRVDRERRGCPPGELMAALRARFETFLPELDALVIQDYGKGVISQDLVDAVCGMAATAGKIVTVDPNVQNPIRWPRVTAVKPNRYEAYHAAGRIASGAPDGPGARAELEAVGVDLLSRWGAECVLLTLGEGGMLLFERGREASPYHTPTRAREVFDVSGAGDTAIALFTLALCAGATRVEAAEIANRASGVVVGKLGTATLSPEELLEAFSGEDA